MAEQPRLDHAVCLDCKRAGFMDPDQPKRCWSCGSTRLKIEAVKPREGV